MKSTFVRLASAASAASTPGSFSAGYVSPVSVASSAKRSFASSSRQSPGMMSPASNMTTSPGTTSSTWTSTGLPLRMTRASIWTMARSLATALLAPRSCQNPSRPLTATMLRMMMESVRSPRKILMIAAKIRMRIIGLLNCVSSRRRVVVLRLAARVLGPYVSRRLEASPADSPLGLLPTTSKTSELGRLQKASSPGCWGPDCGFRLTILVD